MANRSILRLAASALTLLVAVGAHAQARGGPATPAAPDTQGTSPAPVAADPKAPTGNTPPATPSRPMAGYSFGNGSSAPGYKHSVWHAPIRGPVASFPAFAEGEKGASHLTVQLSAAVPFEQQAGPGFVVYRLKGARVLRSNDTNPLVAVHFNTPLVTAKLRNVGKDVELRVELRAQVQPTARIDALPAAAPAETSPSVPPAPPGRRKHVPHVTTPVATSQLVVDFPAGNYLDTETVLK